MSDITQVTPPATPAGEPIEGDTVEAAPTAAPARRSQRSYMEARKATKEAAAEVVKANAEAAQAAKKKAQSTIPAVKGAKAFATKAKEVEAKMAARHAERHEATVEAQAPTK